MMWLKFLSGTLRWVQRRHACSVPYLLLAPPIVVKSLLQLLPSVYFCTIVSWVTRRRRGLYLSSEFDSNFISSCSWSDLKRGSLRFPVPLSLTVSDDALLRYRTSLAWCWCWTEPALPTDFFLAVAKHASQGMIKCQLEEGDWLRIFYREHFVGEVLLFVLGSFCKQVPWC